MRSFLRLYFPQWQAAGQEDDLLRSAAVLKQRLGGVWREVSVPTAAQSPPAPLNQGIWHFSAIRSQLQAARGILEIEQPERIFTLGGDCGIEIIPVSYLQKRYGSRLGVLWFDGHGDLNTPDTSPSGRFHGMPLRTLLGEGHSDFISLLFAPVRPEQVFLLGARDLDSPERDFLARSTIVWMDDQQLARRPQRLIEALKAKSISTLYVHLDLDVLDPTLYPHVKMPTPGGLAPQQLAGLLAQLNAAFDIAGLSLVEYNSPQGEGADITDRLGLPRLLNRA